tara:strand:+ start:604 stop:1203 length:600 start_codon:yes stop_codon:yes gene_type:complete
MAGVKISQLQDGGSLQSNDQLVIARGGLSRSILGNDLLSRFTTLDTKINSLSSTVDSKFVHLSGDVMTGALTLNANPTQGLHAATKTYVDSLSSSSMVAKAWVNFSGTGSSGTANVNAGYNIASVTNLATGQFRINFQRPLMSPYVALVTGYDTTNADDPITGVIHDLTNAYCTVGTMRSDGDSGGNTTTYVCVVFFGF